MVDAIVNMPDAAKIAKAIDKIKKAGEILDESVHATALDCLLHTSIHGDPVLLTRLYYALPKLAFQKKFVAWVKAHSPVSFVEVEHNGGKSRVFRIKKGWKADYFDLGEARENPFWAFESEKREPKAFELDAFYKRLISAVVKAEMELDEEEAKEVSAKIVALLPPVMDGPLKEARARALEKKKEAEKDAAA